MQTVLLIEDNPGIRELVADYLGAHGLRVRSEASGPEGLQAARAHAPDLVLLDVMLPGLDGLEVLRRLRVLSAVPVLLLTARDSELDKVLGLELGADDYLTKPFSVAELLARVRALLRRTAELRGGERWDGYGPQPGRLKRGVLELDQQARSLRVRGLPAALTRSEFQLIELLMRHPMRVFTREELLEHLHRESGEGGDLGSERTIDVHVRNLRAKVEDRPARPRWLETVFGFGYRLNPENTAPEHTGPDRADPAGEEAAPPERPG